MPGEPVQQMRSAIEGTIKSQGALLDGLSDWLQGLSHDLVAAGGPKGQSIKNALNGVWLGHALHPALTDVALGAWVTSSLLDLLDEPSAADKALLIGVLSSLPTAAAGAADWSDTQDEPRRAGLAHAILNTGALGCFAMSLLARRSGSRALGAGLSATGLALASVSAWIGGELVYNAGTAVSRTAWEPMGTGDFQVAARAESLSEGQLAAGEIVVDGQTVRLVLLKRGNQVLALSGTCTHWGGPLAEGRFVEGDCVECPWHGSRFDMHDGRVVQGPASVAQPLYEARIREHNAEVRRVS